MKLGPTLRSLMPFRLERKAAKIYRSVFVDMAKVAERLAEAIPEGSNVLDIGGGDGELLNLILERRPDLRFTMVDIAPSVGKFIQREFGDRVSFCPATSIESHLEGATASYDAAIVSDVMHHIPSTLRLSFLQCVKQALRPGKSLFIKDVEPGHLVATMSLYADIHISGDRGVRLISMVELTDLASKLHPRRVTELGLIREDRPNYLLEIAFHESPRE